MKTPYWLRVLIAIDALIQITWRRGNPGVTMSSRAGTAQAHGHRWGCVLCAFLDRAWWLGFGKDADGTGHCESAVKHDIERAQTAIVELTDPIVTAYYANKPATRWMPANPPKPPKGERREHR